MHSTDFLSPACERDAASGNWERVRPEAECPGRRGTQQDYFLWLALPPSFQPQRRRHQARRMEREVNTMQPHKSSKHGVLGRKASCSRPHACLRRPDRDARHAPHSFQQSMSIIARCIATHTSAPVSARSRQAPQPNKSQSPSHTQYSFLRRDPPRAPMHPRTPPRIHHQVVAAPPPPAAPHVPPRMRLRYSHGGSAPGWAHNPRRADTASAAAAAISARLSYVA